MATGWVTGPTLPSDGVDRLRALARTLHLDHEHAYFSSNVHGRNGDAARVDHAVRAELGPLFAPLLPSHRPFLAALISKGARHGSRVAFHQDWTYTDERVARSVLVWMPLVDVEVSNGALRMVDGSHRWTDGLRPGPGREPGPELQAALGGKATTCPLGAGQTIVYDPAILHGSWPNGSGDVRTAAAIAFAPIGADLVHFHREGDGPVRGYRVDDDYFLTQDFQRPPSGYDEIDPWARAVGDGDLAPHLVGTMPATTSEVVPEPDVAMPSPSPGSAWRSTLRAGLRRHARGRVSDR